MLHFFNLDSHHFVQKRWRGGDVKQVEGGKRRQGAEGRETKKNKGKKYTELEDTEI